jgi:hypothetical protein
MLWRRDTKLRGEAADVVTEAEWLLAGHSAVGYAACGEEPPAWSLVGVLAYRGHGDLQRLGSADVCTTGPWTTALVGLAAELMDQAATPAELFHVQRETLIPLMCYLLGGAAEPATPGELADLVRGALHARRQAT